MPVSAPSARLLPALECCFTGTDPIESKGRLLVAFSAGPDSTALLWGLAQLRPTHGFHLEAAHVDHRLDPDSPARAEAASRICRRLEVPLTVVARRVPSGEIAKLGLEAAARAIRYRVLDELRLRVGASCILTAHHRDDQVETVLLRLLHGSGWRGLAGIPARNRAVRRPLLELGRDELRDALAGSGLEPVLDPSNLDLSLERNRLRQRLLPHLREAAPELDSCCLGIAAAAARARRRVDARLTRALGLEGVDSEATLSIGALERLPPDLLPAAAALLHRASGASYPPSRAAVRELARQLRAGNTVGGDSGDGWRWQAEGDRLRLLRSPAATPQFTYTLRVPGEVDLKEISLRLRIDRSPVATWMFEGSPTRTGLGGALGPQDAITVRNRRPGDRLRPLGCAYSRKLKDVLIDRRIPRAERDRIPLVCVGDRIAWVPGVTIDERFRIGDEDRAWVLELEPLELKESA